MRKKRKNKLEDEFNDIYKLISQSNLSPNIFKQSINELCNDKTNKISLTLIIFALIILIHGNIILKLMLGEDKRCLIQFLKNDLFIEPFDCTHCSKLHFIEILTNISQDDFEKKYAYSNIPLVIKGATKQWKAMKYFNFNFFQQIYGLHKNYYRCQFFPYRTDFNNLQEALETLSLGRNKSWYIGWSNCDPNITEILRDYYTKPYFLPKNSETSRLDWIFMGTPGYGAPMHIDHVGHPSWQAQIKGSKLWILEAPSECYFSCKRLQVQLNPGDIIIVDTDKWFHQTEILGNEISITIGSEYD